MQKYKETMREFYRNEEEQRIYLPAYTDYDSKQLARMTHLEAFSYPVWEEAPARMEERLETPVLVLFDYKERDALTGEARTVKVGEE